MSARPFSHISVVNNKTHHYQNRSTVLKIYCTPSRLKTPIGCDPGLSGIHFVVKHRTFFLSAVQVHETNI